MFNYQKAYCTIAVPAFNNLSDKAKEVHTELIPLVTNLSQGSDLNIPMTVEISALIESLTTKEIAEMSRASYFVGHWKPGLVESPFDNPAGISWKIANCCDQILRRRLDPPKHIEIHEGVFRVTYSSEDCWTWEEFSLATEENLEIFKTCGLPFGESTLHKSADKLKELTGDLWPNVESLPNNELYEEYLRLEKEKERKKIESDLVEKLNQLKKKEEEAYIKAGFLRMCNRKGVPIDNVIYYSHKGVFCFGWRGPLNDKEKEQIKSALADEDYNIEFK